METGERVVRVDMAGSLQVKIETCGRVDRVGRVDRAGSSGLAMGQVAYR